METTVVTMTENCCDTPYAVSSCMTTYTSDDNSNNTIACYTNGRCQRCLVGGS